MPYRSWFDINPETSRAGRPTVTRMRTTIPEKRASYTRGVSSPMWRLQQTTREPYEAPVISAAEILREMQQQFEDQPLSYETDPQTGKVIASRSMPRPEMPSEMYGQPWRIRSLFAEPGKESDPLSMKWILPPEALTGPRFINYDPPATDYQRQRAWERGMTNIGSPLAMPNPQTFWPESSFRIPLRDAPDLGVPEPIFGGTMDYTRGQIQTPQAPGAFNRLTTGPTWGRLPTGTKSPPGYGDIPMMGAFQTFKLPSVNTTPRWPGRSTVRPMWR